MVSFNGGATGATFVVGSEGLRSRKTVSGVGAGDRLYAYDDQRRLVGVYVPDGSGGFTVSEELVYLPESWRIVGTVRGQVVSGANGTFYPVLSDQIETPRVVLDPSSGDARWTWEGREAFGASAPNENPASVGAFRFDARFPGQWFDAETGLFHNGFRDYDPGTGRYVQSDPIGLGGGWNTYAYVGGKPSFAFDLLGLSEADVEKFRSQFRITVDRMTREGIRHPDPRINNRYGQWGDTWMKYVPFIDGNPLARMNGIKNGGYEVCSGQTRILGADLYPLQAGGTDDVWKITNPYSGSHYWIEARSSNPNDPLIIMDPWKNSFQTIRVAK